MIEYFKTWFSFGRDDSCEKISQTHYLILYLDAKSFDIGQLSQLPIMSSNERRRRAVCCIISRTLLLFEHTMLFCDHVQDSKLQMQNKLNRQHRSMNVYSTSSLNTFCFPIILFVGVFQSYSYRSKIKMQLLSLKCHDFQIGGRNVSIVAAKTREFAAVAHLPNQIECCSIQYRIHCQSISAQIFRNIKVFLTCFISFHFIPEILKTVQYRNISIFYAKQKTNYKIKTYSCLENQNQISENRFSLQIVYQRWSRIVQNGFRQNTIYICLEIFRTVLSKLGSVTVLSKGHTGMYICMQYNKFIDTVRGTS